jgi:hypothetical protein
MGEEETVEFGYGQPVKQRVKDSDVLGQELPLQRRREVGTEDQGLWADPAARIQSQSLWIVDHIVPEKRRSVFLLSESLAKCCHKANNLVSPRSSLCMFFKTFYFVVFLFTFKISIHQ